MRKKTIIITALLVLIVLAICTTYVIWGMQRVEVQTHSYLLNKDCTNEDIASITVNFTSIKPSFTYNGWKSTVKFVDEPNAEYYFTIKDGQVVISGFSGNATDPSRLRLLE